VAQAAYQLPLLPPHLLFHSVLLFIINGPNGNQSHQPASASHPGADASYTWEIFIPISLAQSLYTFSLIIVYFESLRLQIYNHFFK